MNDNDTGNTDNRSSDQVADDFLREAFAGSIERRQRPITQMAAEREAQHQADADRAEQWADPDAAIRDLASRVVGKSTVRRGELR